MGVYNVVIKALGGQSNWLLMVRVMRCVVLLLSPYRQLLEPHQVSTLLQVLLQMLDDGSIADGKALLLVTPLWHRTLTLETLLLILAEPDICKQTARVKDKGAEEGSLFKVTVVQLSHLVSLTLVALREGEEEDSDSGIALSLSFTSAERPTKGLDLLNEHEPPASMNEAMVVVLAAECLAVIANGLALSFDSSFTVNAPIVHIGNLRRRVSQFIRTPSPTPSSDSGVDPIVDDTERDLIGAMLSQCWQPMLRALAKLLEWCHEETVAQFLIKAYMSLTNTFAVLDMVEPRDAFIMSLCTFALPHWHSTESINVVPRDTLRASLKPKHVQALKALFNVAHGMGNMLGSAWHIVLETFDQLDHIMFLAKADSASGGNAAKEVSLVDDELAIIESMLRSLFDSTRYLNDEGLCSLQTALTQLVFAGLAHAETVRSDTDGEVDIALARAVYRTPPFSLEKLVETTRLNVFRLQVVWDMTQNSLAMVANKSDDKLRIYSVQAMEQIVTAALLFSPDKDKDKDKAREKSREKSQRRRTYPPPALLEMELIHGVAQLIKSQYKDTREAALQALGRIISACGHVLDKSWAVIVEELVSIAELATPIHMTNGQQASTATPRAGDQGGEGGTDYVHRDRETVAASAMLPSGFKVLEIIVDEFLPSLNPDLRSDLGKSRQSSLPRSLNNTLFLAHCIRAFGDQTQHVNMSLTAVNMLWTLCDLLQRECVDVKTTGTAEAAEQLGSANMLLLAIFHELWHLSLDARPEVRNSAVRTLCSIMVACASKLSTETWRVCTLDILFPLLVQINKHAANATEVPVQGERLSRFRDTRMDVHHSRNTHEKQWRETKVTALQGSARVVRACLQHCGDQAWTLKVWTTLLGVLQDTLVGSRRSSKEVAMAAVKALSEMGAVVCESSTARIAAVGMKVIDGALVTHPPTNGQLTQLVLGAKDGPTRLQLWTATWKVYEASTGNPEYLRHGNVQSPVAARQSAGSSGEGGHENGNGQSTPCGIDSEDVATELVSRLGEMYSNSKIHLEFLRGGAGVERTLALLRRVVYMRGMENKSSLISGLQRAVLKTISQIPPVHDWGPLLTTIQGFVEDATLSKGFRAKAVSAYEMLFQDHMPSGSRAIVLEVSLREMSEHNRDVSNELLPPLFKYGLRSITATEWAKPRTSKIFANVVDVLKSSVFDLELQIPNRIAILDAVMTEIRPLLVAKLMPRDAKDELVKMLAAGCEQRESKLFSKACLAHLLLLFSNLQSADLFRWVLKGLDNVVDQYVEETEVSPNEQRDEELLAVLQRLDIRHLSEEDAQQMRIKAFPILIKLVTVDSKKVRLKLKDILAMFLPK